MSKVWARPKASIRSESVECPMGARPLAKTNIYAFVRLERDFGGACIDPHGNLSTAMQLDRTSCKDDAND